MSTKKEMWPVMLTPFTERGEVDYDGLEKLIEFYEEGGSDGLFATCQSSEIFYLSLEERTKIASFVKKHAHIPVIASGHVSYSREDQAVKLEVRSFLLDYILDRLPEHADSKEAVITWLSENKRNLETAATRFLTKKQMPYSARLSLEQAWFPTRVYDNLVIPCGTYDAARVILGEGNGHNWWCVLYPRFCFLDEVCKEIPAKSRRELQDKLNQGDYPLLEDHRPDLKIQFFFFPYLQPALPSHNAG